MAMRCSPSNITITRGQTKRIMIRPVMANMSIQPSKVLTLIKPSLSIKVFEDQARGIICYRDVKGELICEGYDEGPRYSREPSHKIQHTRCRVRISGFEQRLLQILEEQN